MHRQSQYLIIVSYGHMLIIVELQKPTKPTLSESGDNILQLVLTWRAMRSSRLPCNMAFR